MKDHYKGKVTSTYKRFEKLRNEKSHFEDVGNSNLINGLKNLVLRY